MSDSGSSAGGRRPRRFFASDRVLRESASYRPFAGTVERRAPGAYQRPAEQLTWRCVSPYCRQWTSARAYETGVCNHCGTPRPPRHPASAAEHSDPKG